MSDPTLTGTSGREQLSALVDGELESSAVGTACAAWRNDESLRSDWRTYHLIGDVLRSEDLAFSAAHDAAFMASFRKALAQEPVVLAPEPIAVEQNLSQPSFGLARGRNKWAWVAPSAVAASVVTMAGMLLLSRAPFADIQAVPASSQVARQDSRSMPQMLRANGAPSLPPLLDQPESPNLVVSDAVIRDAQLDTYLAAHQQFAASSLIGAPSGFLRKATAELPSR